MKNAESEESSVVFEVTGVTKVYPMGEVLVHALRGADLTVQQGELVVILGQSGSGKSTLLNILGGLDVPTEGTVRYRGRSLQSATERELTEFRRKSVGFVFQFYNLMPSLTARENVALVTEISTNPIDPAEALGMVGLADRLDHFPSQMSGGQQQRVAIARAIAKRPDVLLCDEPTGALDLSTSRVVLDVLTKANERLGTTTLLITHNDVIAQIADRVVYIKDGRIDRIKHNERRTKAFDLSW